MFTVDDLRFGAVEAVATPPAVPAPERHSTQLFIDYEKNTNSLSATAIELNAPQRIVSQGSTLPTPLSPDAARSSYMTSGTDTSRMSGLSDFPVPPAHDFPLPQQQQPSSESLPLSVSAEKNSNHAGSEKHLGEKQLDEKRGGSQMHLDVPRPRPVSREPSQDTFGGNRGEYTVGEAL